MGLFDSVGKALGVSTGDLFTGGMTALGGYFQRQSDKAESARNRAFQERMSNTAYQRSMSDMRAAGLNPMLAYQQGGASSPSGAMAAAAPNIGKDLSEGVSAKLLRDNMKAQNNLLQAQTTAQFESANATHYQGLAAAMDAQLKAMDVNSYKQAKEGPTYFRDSRDIKGILGRRLEKGAQSAEQFYNDARKELGLK